MTLHDYIRILRKGWLFLVVGVLLGVAAGAMQTILATPKYEASTKVFVSLQVSESPSPGELVSGNSYAQQKVKSYIDLVTSPLVLQPVIDELGLSTSTQGLAGQVSATAASGTVIIEISATSADPQMAANIANATAASLQRVVVDELERPAGGGPSLVKMQSVQPAAPASRPSSPNLYLNLAIGGLVGLVLGLGAAILRTTLDTRVHGRHDVEALTTAPVIGGIAFDPESNRHPLIVHTDPRNPRAEAFRSLRTNLRFVNVDGDERTFVVTSAVPGEGKSTTTANLALALAESGARVVIIEGDLRLPKLAKYLGIEGSVGLTDVLIGRVPLADVLQKWGTRDLYVLPAGQVPPNPSELLGSDAMVSLLRALSEQVDYILIDAPPLLPVTDAAVLASLTSGAIVVAAAGRVRKTELAAALRSLSQTDSHIVGLVLTMLPNKGPDAYGGAYSYYGTSAGDQAERPQPTPSKESRSSKRARTGEEVRTR